MKLDHDYIKKILSVLEEQDKARPYVDEILRLLDLEDMDEVFVLHYEVLIDSGYIQTLDDYGFSGITQDSSGEIIYSDGPIRLTAQGHEFIAALNKPEVWSVIQKEFKDSSLKTIYKVATRVVEGYAKQQINRLFKDDSEGSKA